MKIVSNTSFKKVIFFSLFYLGLIVNGFAQATYTISGKVTDAQTGEGIPFASIILKGKSIGTQTDFEGNFKIITRSTADSLFVSYIGYIPKTKALTKESEQVVNIQLTSSQILKEVVVYARRENPAYGILRKVDENKDRNDFARLKAYQYEAYNRVAISVNNLSDGAKKNKIIKDIYGKLQEIKDIRDKDANVVIPIFTSESLSDVYYRTNPNRIKEFIKKTYAKGLGVTDDEFIAQLTNSGYNTMNFYQNWVGLFRKEFMSPLAKGGNGFYKYYLKDTTKVGLYNCYKIDFDPINPHDLAFQGTAWIDTTHFALVQIEANLDKTANINFIDKIQIHQEYERLGENEEAWMPEKTRLVINASGLLNSGAIISLSANLKDVIANQPKDIDFYNAPAIEVLNDSKNVDETYWAKQREDKMTKDEQLSFALIDTVSKVPSYRRMSNLVDFFVDNGHIKLNKYIDVGSTFFSYAYNNIERNRLWVGLRTSPTFSKNVVIRGNVGYGTRDKVFKGGVDMVYAPKRGFISRFGMKAAFDIDQIGIKQEEINDSPLFQVLSHFGTLKGAYYQRNYQMFLQKDFFQNFSQSVTLSQRKFYPLYHFDKTGEFNNEKYSIITDFTNPELILESRYIPNRLPSRNPNKIRIKSGSSEPIIGFKYTIGNIKDTAFKQLEDKLGVYHIFEASFSHVLRFGILGKTEYTIEGYYTPSLLPINLLKVHLGNQTSVYAKNTFNLMQYSEFASDKFMALSFRHSFDGLMTNRIPVVNKWGWRTFLLGKVLYGSLRSENENFLSKYFDDDDFLKNNLLHPVSLGNKPYVELGYGIENIFNCLSIAGIHRLTHTGMPNVKSFGVRASFKISL